MPLTPMMQNYMETKKEYSDCILFYRLGDFYEMFYDDAKVCSKELELALTGKSCGLEERAPMCGVPFHAVDAYLNKLVSKGYKVAICEQVEDPKKAKGIVKREVVRIATPGTNLNTQALDESKNNYLMCVAYVAKEYGASYVDVTTGDFYVTKFDSKSKLFDEIGKVSPSEIICGASFISEDSNLTEIQSVSGAAVSAAEPRFFDEDGCRRALMEHFRTASLSGLGLDGFGAGITAAGAIMQYLTETQKISLDHITGIKPYLSDSYMMLDRSTRRNLELCETMREKSKKGSLFWVLDKTKTAMGARLLRKSIEQPLLNIEDINARLDAVSELNENMILREEIRECLNQIYDLERLIGKIGYKTANPRDLAAFKQSLSTLPRIKELLASFEKSILKKCAEKIDDLKDIYELIDSAIDEEPPISTRDGGIIKDGYDEEVDRLRRAKTDGKKWLAQLVEEEKERTGIKNLRVKYNKVFGYHLEVTNSYKDLVPSDWTRRQTLANAERYTTPKLKELEDSILGAEDRLFNLEHDLFCGVRDEIYECIGRVQNTAHIIAYVDMFASLAAVAQQSGFVRPNVNDSGIIDVKNGRHPVVERMIGDDMFVANDTFLDNKNHRISIITGPNMAGKSTYMRQTALIVLMAQIGSFVPAESATIGVVDRIFTRVGASDDLASGQSTFMVEMTEVANIIRNATRQSLIILDEIGRGTSTFDGLGIAWAVIEHIADVKLLGAKTLFATHYHELTELEGKLDSVDNYRIAVKERGDDIVFLRKIMRGGADKSYGIQVARLAGVPEDVLRRAEEIVAQLSNNDIAGRAKKIEGGYDSDAGTGHNCHKEQSGQLSFFNDSSTGIKTDDVIDELQSLDLPRMTPIDAMNVLNDMQARLKKRTRAKKQKSS